LKKLLRYWKNGIWYNLTTDNNIIDGETTAIFIKEDKENNTYRHTKKGMEFLLEFNSKFWIEKYKTPTRLIISEEL